jgi:hypothetical protein
MGYRESLEAAGAIVIAYKEFGSYQGDWFAAVVYQGQHGVVQGAFGSCSGCDAFEDEFGAMYSSEDTPEEYQARLKKFGENYLNHLMSIDEAIAYAEKNVDWDLDAQEMEKWVRSLRNLQFANKLEEVLKSDL